MLVDEEKESVVKEEAGREEMELRTQWRGNGLGMSVA